MTRQDRHGQEFPVKSCGHRCIPRVHLRALMSYESKEEAALLKSFGAGKSGEAENTLFCILGPDGKRLIKATREPRARPPNSPPT